jgi:predicted metal-dependent HD superfamily phosphohydrolase
MNYTELSKKVEEHQLNYFRSHQDHQLVYHNLNHTLAVVKAAIQIANHYQLDDRDFFIVTTAAWFHDVGYFQGANNHEVKGAQMAQAFLHELGVDKETTQMISHCIIATTLPQNPKTTLEEVVCDADFFHFGTDDFWERNKLLRKEIENRKGASISKNEWRKSTTQLLITHHFFTDYCRLLLNDKKEEHLEKLQEREVKKNKVIDRPVIIETQNPTEVKKNEEKNNRPVRGVETMFRISSNNNQRLSDMADNKAHIMISVNSIILSAVISLVLRKLDEYYYLAWPTYMIMCVSILTIIYSILATRPSVPKGTFTKHDLEERKVNLLFFGNYHKMSLEDYTFGMEQVMNDRIFIYKTLIKDVYAQGVVLGRKYKLLRIAYNIFMFGLIASVIAFVAASVIAEK